MNAIIKRYLLIGLSLLSTRCMCYCPPAYDPCFSFYVESDLSNFSMHQIEPIILNDNGDTLRLSSSYSAYDTQAHWYYDDESDIENQRIVCALELKNEKDSVISVVILDTFNFSTDRSRYYLAYARQNGEQGYTYEDRFSIGTVTGNNNDTLFIREL